MYFDTFTDQQVTNLDFYILNSKNETNVRNYCFRIVMCQTHCCVQQFTVPSKILYLHLFLIYTCLTCCVHITLCWT